MYRWLSIAVVVAALAATVFWALEGGGSGGPKPGRAIVEVHDGLTIVHVSGPPRAKGRALGEALRDRIRNEIARALPEPGVREFALKACGDQLAPFLPATYREEIEGVAEGAGITFDEALFLDTRFEIAAFGLAGGAGDLPAEAAVGPGPEAGCLLSGDDLVVVVHEDHSPPLILLGRPGMTGGFLAISGNVAAAMRPMHEETPPTLKGLVWTLLLRRLVEAPPAGRWEAPAGMTGPLSVAMLLPDGSAGTLNLSVTGAAWYAAGGSRSLTTDEPAVPREGPVPRLERAPEARAKAAEAAAWLLGGPGPASGIRVVLRGGEEVSLVVDSPLGRRTITVGKD